MSKRKPVLPELLFAIEDDPDFRYDCADAELRAETAGFRARLRTETEAKTQERDQLKSRLSAARARVDALIDRLPGATSSSESST